MGDSHFMGVDEDPACIVGIGCRLPGGINSPSALWEFLIQKRSTQGRVPLERFNIGGFYHPDGSRRAGVIDAEGGYFLQEDVRQFENSFFGINNLEATYMDPQQRKLLEVVAECLEDAGVPLENISGSNTAVYIGNFTVDFQSMQTRDPDYLHRYHGTGTGTGIMANRISHVFNLHGPSFTLDTACSSSLYCLHSAVVALKNGDCDGAIVAGANLINGPEQHIATVKGGVISPTSTCHTFDASADGYGRAEAVNAIYLKRLSSALKDGDTIRAVIRGTAVNATGRTAGISQPSAARQEAVIRKAYNTAGLHIADTDYVEFHGTGTAIGDPIEVDAVGRCFAPRDGLPLIIGAVKPTIGHSEASSGLSSIIKVVLAFENGRIPPTCGVHKVNPKLRLEHLNFKIATELEAWPRSLRRAGINSFGFGGANGHAVLESLDSYFNRDITKATTPQHPRMGYYVLPVSAASRRSLQKRVDQTAQMAKKMKASSLDSLSFTLAERRSHLKFRSFLLATCHDERIDIEPEQPNVVLAQSKGPEPLPIVFLFTGQGAQYPGMAEELFYDDTSIFSATIFKLQSVLQTLPDSLAPIWTLKEMILEPSSTSQIHDADRSQPLCTAIQIGLIELLRNWNIQPTFTVGHSSGEIAAAYAAGLLTIEHAILVAYFRGLAVKQLHTPGQMIAVGLNAEAAETLILEHGLELQVSVACVNSPGSVTLSGQQEGIDKLFEELQGKIFVRKLETNNQAYHSHLMQKAGYLYEELLQQHVWNTSASSCNQYEQNTRMISSVGKGPDEKRAVDRQRVSTPRYWRENLEKQVQFSAALQSVVANGKLHLIEIGPHASLRGPVEQIRTKLGIGKDLLPYSYTLYRGRNANQCLNSLVGNLFVHGHSLKWSAIHGWPERTTNMKPLPNLPPYPWDYSAGLMWNEPRPSVELRNRRHARHELLGSQQLAGNGIDFCWRNILKLDEIAWLRDHKLEAQIVFPAAGYLSLAMEALSQVIGVDLFMPNILCQFQNVNMITAFVVEDNNVKNTELHTSITQRKLSTASKAADWYEFTVSSWSVGLPTLHCAGSIRIDGPENLDDIMSFIKPVMVDDTTGYETWAIERWYTKLREEGLNFGPKFKSLTSLSTDGSRISTAAISTTRLIQRDTQNPDGRSPETRYNINPIVIDACIQAAIMGGTAGNINNLKAYLPSYISSCQIRTPGPNDIAIDGKIHTRSKDTGPATKKVCCTLRDAHDMPVINLKGVHMSLYNGKADTQRRGGDDYSLVSQRNPCLRVNWKPDIMGIFPGVETQLQNYISHFTAAQHESFALDVDENVTVGAILDLASHKNPRIRILQLYNATMDSEKQKRLNAEAGYPHCSSWSSGELDENGKIHIFSDDTRLFDVIIIEEASLPVHLNQVVTKQLRPLLIKHGILVVKTAGMASRIPLDDFEQVVAGKQCLLAIPPTDTSFFTGRDVLIMMNRPSDVLVRFVDCLEQYLLEKTNSKSVHTISLDGIDHVDVTKQLICISMLETEKEFLTTMNSKEMNLLRRVTDIVSDLVWITGAGITSSNMNPNLALASGLSRAIMLEQPSLRFSILDIGRTIFNDSSQTGAQLTCTNISRALIARHDSDDKEFIQVEYILHVSRFVPDKSLNALFRHHLKSSVQQQIYKKTLSDSCPARMKIDTPGLIDTIHFQELREPLAESPPAGFIDVEVKAVGVNAKDVYTIMGRVETQQGTLTGEFSGVVKSVGSNVDLEPGDRVVVLAPTYFHTTEQVPAWAVHKLLPRESFSEMASIPVVYTTALYALHDRAQLKEGESILIHAGAGAFGIAAITIAQRIGACIYTTVSSPNKRDFLIHELGVPETHIFQSRDASFAAGIAKATGGRGVDVVINSLVGDLMHESWACMANFGRFVEIGKQELLDAGKLDMRVFLRNATFTAFDLGDLYYDESHGKDILISKMREVLDLYRHRYLKCVPLTIFDVSDIAQAYRRFSQKERIGKIVISMENPKSSIPTAPPKYRTIFDPNKVYLLVGCLGGLGRSLSRWMMARGARNFVFLGRSGCDKPEARSLVSRLRHAGAAVAVIRGDVAKRPDVKASVEACNTMGKSIGGVVQAAMGLHEALFSRMPNEAWHTVIQPKWAGTWNLHTELECQNLDFFLLTSSVSGSVGTATESNYCAANAFLDAFSQWQRQRGIPSVSVGLGMISEVGYLHENPNIEALLLRKGIQPLSEDEFLQVIDLALSSNTRGSDDHTSAHILTGLEPFGLHKLMARGFEVDNGTMQDPRTMIISAALIAEQESRNAARRTRTSLDAGAPIPKWLESIPAHIAESFLAVAESSSLDEAVLQLIRKRFSDLILIPVDQVDHNKTLGQFGVDSMIASEFRTWFWRTFRVDVPFLNILSPSMDLNMLAKFVETKLVSSANEDENSEEAKG
ncbi:polyketide synthase [Whalleya microplaca]|nr:polyketide synthase [Whalleya microplaca]